jgi:hypothetical protein
MGPGLVFITSGLSLPNHGRGDRDSSPSPSRAWTPSARTVARTGVPCGLFAASPFNLLVFWAHPPPVFPHSSAARRMPARPRTVTSDRFGAWKGASRSLLRLPASPESHPGVSLGQIIDLSSSFACHSSIPSSRHVITDDRAGSAIPPGKRPIRQKCTALTLLKALPTAAFAYCPFQPWRLSELQQGMRVKR